MKLIIAGGRDHELGREDYQKINAIHSGDPITEVVSGRALGVDRCGELWADVLNIPIRAFPADWKTLGKSAGPMRNKRMAEYADAVALFKGGSGTHSMFGEAKKAGITIYDFRP